MYTDIYTHTYMIFKRKKLSKWEILLCEKTAYTGGQNFLLKLLASNLLLS